MILILGIILFILIIKMANKAYKKASSRNISIVGNYLYQIIKAANRN